jgi:hypothetical protein
LGQYPTICHEGLNKTTNQHYPSNHNIQYQFAWRNYISHISYIALMWTSAWKTARSNVGLHTNSQCMKSNSDYNPRFWHQNFIKILPPRIVNYTNT